MRLATAVEVADMLRVKPARVYELARSEMIPTVKLGRQVRFDLDSIETWIANGGTPLTGGWRRESDDARPAA